MSDERCCRCGLPVGDARTQPGDEPDEVRHWACRPAVEATLADAQRDKYKPIWAVVDELGLGAGGCPDALILTAFADLKRRADDAEAHAATLTKVLRSFLKAWDLSDEAYDGAPREIGESLVEEARAAISAAPSFCGERVLKMEEALRQIAEQGYQGHCNSVQELVQVSDEMVNAARAALGAPKE